MSTDIAIDVPAAAPEATRTGSRRLTILVAVLLVLTLVGWGVRRYIFSRHHVNTDNAQVDGHITVVSPRIQGFIARVLVEENQHVKAGDTLVVLDDRDVRVRLHQAEAQLQATQAQAASAQAAVAAAEADFRKAAADLERYRGLAAKQIISAQQLDAAQAAYDAATANLLAARKQAAAAGSQVSASGAAVRGADARVAAAQAAVDNGRLQLSYTALLAPVDGMVAKRTAEPGAQVQVGQNLMSVVPDK